MRAVSVSVVFYFLIISSVYAANENPPSNVQNELITAEITEIQNNSRLIEDLVQNLRLAAQQAIEAIQKFSVGVQAEIALFGERVLQNIGQLREKVTQTANEVISRFQNAGASLTSCIEIHRNDANHLFSDTISKTMICADERISSIESQIANLANITTHALAYADSVLKRLATCTSENRNDLIAAGSCLSGVVMETQLKTASFTVESGLSTARLSMGVATLPLTLQGCAAARLTETALGTARIAIDIGSCSATSFFSAFTNTITGRIN